jgi:hypothetical protein
LQQVPRRINAFLMAFLMTSAHNTKSLLHKPTL